MNPIVRNILAIIGGLLVGSAINMGIILLGSSIVPPPPGSDTSTMEGLKAAMQDFESRHFIFPFLAHALGSFCGALVAAGIAATHKMKFAMAVGIFFLVGGIINAISLPAPTWFIVLDLAIAYLPMSYLGGRLAIRQ